MWSEEQLEIVRERLNFINELSEVRKHFRGPGKTKNLGIRTVTHSYEHFSALRIYLCLTCFDILGQPDNWTNFNSWLESKSRTDERNEILKKHSKKNHQDFLISVHKDYNNIYGVRKSFFQFIKKSLSAENKVKLFRSIAGQKQLKGSVINSNGSMTPGTGINIELTQKQKEYFLFNIRNSFTHKGISMGNSFGGFFDEDQPLDIGDEKPVWLFQTIHRQKINGNLILFSVCRWPLVLIEIIKDTIK